MRFLKNCSKIAFEEKSKELLFFWFSASCRSQVNWNLLKTAIKKEICPKITFLPFFSKHFRMTIKPFKIAEKIIFISRKINLNIQNLKIILYNQTKKKNSANSTWCVIFAVQYKNIYILSKIKSIQAIVFVLEWTGVKIHCCSMHV